MPATFSHMGQRELGNGVGSDLCFLHSGSRVKRTEGIGYPCESGPSPKPQASVGRLVRGPQPAVAGGFKARMGQGTISHGSKTSPGEFKVFKAPSEKAQEGGGIGRCFRGTLLGNFLYRRGSK